MKYRSAPSMSVFNSGKAQLSYGMQGVSVKALQKKLGVTVDGYFGPKTLAALKAAQQKQGLTGQSGVVNSTSLKLLQSDSFGATTKAGSQSKSSVDSYSSDGGVCSVDTAKGSSTMNKLAQAAESVGKSMGGYRGLGKCATGFTKALRNATGLTVTGNGNQIAGNLPKNKFKEVKMSLAEALKIPGLVLTWAATSTGLGRKYGHVAVTKGDGQSSSSDFVERNTLAAESGRSGLRIYMPIG